MKQTDDIDKAKDATTKTGSTDTAVDDEIQTAAWQALREALLRQAIKDTSRSGC